MAKKINIHILGAQSSGNIGTVAAQRALYKMLLENDEKFDVSISVIEKETFKKYHPEFSDCNIYGPLRPIIGSKLIKGNLQWVLINLLNLPVFFFSAILMTLNIRVPYRNRVINRLRSCDVFIDLNLELLKGIPISVSSDLIRKKSRILVFHKLFWSYRMLNELCYIFVVKSVFKKKVILGPASFGPFNSLPLLTQRIVRFILNNYVDVILVREPLSAAILGALGVRKYILTTDAALTVKSDSSSVDSGAGYVIGFAPAMLSYTMSRDETTKYIIAHAKCIDELVSKYKASIVFLPSSPDDIAMCKAVMAKATNVQNMQLIITDDVDTYECWVRKLTVLITSRMHPSIIAARNFVPFSVLLYDHKQIGVLKQLGLEQYSMPIGRTTYESLKLSIELVLQNKSAITKKLVSTLPKLQKETKKAIQSQLVA